MHYDKADAALGTMASDDYIRQLIDQDFSGQEYKKNRKRLEWRKLRSGPDNRFYILEL